MRMDGEKGDFVLGDVFFVDPLGCEKLDWSQIFGDEADILSGSAMHGQAYDGEEEEGKEDVKIEGGQPIEGQADHEEEEYLVHPHTDWAYDFVIFRLLGFMLFHQILIIFQKSEL